MKKYIEIVKDENEEVVKRIDVSGMAERQIDRIENGANINLNHAEYHTRITESELELPKI